MNAEFINGLSNNFITIKMTVHQRVSLKIVEDVDFGLCVIGLLLTTVYIHNLLYIPVVLNEGASYSK
jgi:hypothetical protein